MRTLIEYPRVRPGEGSRCEQVLATADHPNDLLESDALSLEEKRAALASWASDSHAVEGVPALRQLESGAVVPLEEILSALRRLDLRVSGEPPGRPRPRLARSRRFGSRMRAYLARPRRRDDDDDPPPCAVALAVPQRPMLAAIGR